MVLEELVESISIAFKPPTIEVVAINDLADTKTMAHLLKYDSIHGVLPQASADEKGILVEEDHFYFFMRKKIYLEKF
jgi:glyceraldehyde 3-phosphate dehydrogenase